MTLAAGVRAFTAGRNHRAFVEVSVSQVATQSVRLITGGTSDFGDGERLYGPRNKAAISTPPAVASHSWHPLVLPTR